MLTGRDAEIALLKADLAYTRKQRDAAQHDLKVFKHNRVREDEARVSHEKERLAHLNRFFTHPSRSRLAPFFPNAKEVTESYGAFHAVNTHLPHLDRGDAGVVVVVVGDGHSPRTGALFAMSSAWRVYSVDPVIRFKYNGAVERLVVLPLKVEDAAGYLPESKKVLIVAVHSHACLRDAVRAVGPCERLDVVSIPCCVPQFIPYVDEEGRDTLVKIKPDVAYEDQSILSPERTVLVWKDVYKRREDQGLKELTREP